MGSTTDFTKRKYQHKSDCNNEKYKQYNCKLYKMIRAHGNWESFKIMIICEFPCNSKIELIIEEEKHRKELQATLNSNKAFRSNEEAIIYKKEYRETNKEKAKVYYENNKELINEKRKAYRDNNKELIKEKRKEKSATGTGASFTAGTGANYATPYAFNPNKKAKGAKNIYYYKLGFKPVNRKALNKAAKGIEVKHLWEETESKFDIESFISSLNTNDEELKNYIAGRLGDFDLLANRIKELISLIQEAKKETINSYRENPEFKAIYGTDLAIKTIDNAIKLFT